MKVSSNSLAAVVENGGVATIVLCVAESFEVVTSITIDAEAELATNTSKAAASHLWRRNLMKDDNGNLVSEKSNSDTLATFVFVKADFLWLGKETVGFPPTVIARLLLAQCGNRGSSSRDRRLGWDAQSRLRRSRGPLIFERTLQTG